MSFELSVETGTAQATVRPAGRLTAGDAQLKLREEIDPLLERGFERLVIDLAQVTYIDSAGLGELMRARSLAAERGTSLLVQNPSKQVTAVLQLTGLAAVLGPAASAPTARAQDLDAAPPSSE
jgi:anti-sigma B factor antagonist